MAWGYTSSAQQTPHQERQMEMSQKHLDRVKEREARTAKYEKYMDSLILSHEYSFIPTTFQQQPAGMPRTIYNPNFRLGVYSDFVDVYLPYIKGITPPYYITIINYTLPYIENYVAVQGEDSWTISFKSNLFSVNNYTFTFTIYTKTGEANLDISSNMYNTVTYSGSIVGHY